MKKETRKYIITGVTPILGGSPSDKKVYGDYIAPSAPDPIVAQDEIDGLPPEDENKKGITVFLRDPMFGALSLRDYQVKGFIKEAMEALRSELGVAQARSKVDRYVFLHPLWLPLRRDGIELIQEPDSLFERPLRAETMRGPRIALACSEQVDVPWKIDFSVTLLPNLSSSKSQAVTFEVIEAALDYGALKGLGQFRNGSYGRFEYRRTE